MPKTPKLTSLTDIFLFLRRNILRPARHQALIRRTRSTAPGGRPLGTLLPANWVSFVPNLAGGQEFLAGEHTLRQLLLGPPGSWVQV